MYLINLWFLSWGKHQVYDSWYSKQGANYHTAMFSPSFTLQKTLKSSNNSLALDC